MTWRTKSPQDNVWVFLFWIFFFFFFLETASVIPLSSQITIKRNDLYIVSTSIFLSFSSFQNREADCLLAVQWCFFISQLWSCMCQRTTCSSPVKCIREMSPGRWSFESYAFSLTLIVDWKVLISRIRVWSFVPGIFLLGHF